MSVDYRNIIMYGKEFDCFVDAMTDLLGSGCIDEEEFEYILYNEEYNDLDDLLTWQVYSCYTGGAGVLGVEISAKTLYTKPQECATLFASVDGKLGKGCEVHEFVQVY